MKITLYYLYINNAFRDSSQKLRRWMSVGRSCTIKFTVTQKVVCLGT